MKLVVSYQAGDGFTFSATNNVCVNYKSEEDFLIDFEAWSKENRDKNLCLVCDGFLGLDLMPDVFFENEFKVQTLEQWFDENANVE